MELAGASPEEQEKIIKKAAEKLLENYGSEESSAQIATEVHKTVYDMLGNSDPYRQLKERSNEVAKKILTEAEGFINKSKDKLEGAIICSIIGNSIDFGIEGSISSPEKLEKEFDEELEKGLQHNDLEKIKKYLKGNVLYFTDNCGEVVFDKLVCRELKKYDIHLTLVVKGAPVLTDATYEDAVALNFSDVVDEIMTTELFAVGINFDRISENLKNKIRNASLIICKGMANYEAFSDMPYRPIVYFLKVKCKSIAEDMELPLGVSAIKLYE